MMRFTPNRTPAHSAFTFKSTASRRMSLCLALTLPLILAACSDDDMGDMANGNAMNELPVGQDQPFELRFAAVHGDMPVTCGQAIENLGIGGQSSMQVGDLRFYVSDVELLDANGQAIAHTLDTNEFQYRSDDGEVALIDLTDTSTGACAGDGLNFVEGTERVNATISGLATDAAIESVRFSVGLPQPLMKAVIAENTLEGAPSPMNEMYWSWASGYRHFVMNISTAHSDGSIGSGNVHVGSRGCTGEGEGENALETIDQCRSVNTPKVELSGLQADSVIAVDVASVVADVDFLNNVTDENREPVLDETGAIVTQSGVACHSAPVMMQPDCGPVFANMGLNPEDGTADAASNIVFSVR